MADPFTMTSGAIELGFVIKGYPGTGRRIEAESDLAKVSRPDLIQGAFMGDAVLRTDEVDFTTRFGWMTLIDWCLRLADAVSGLEESGRRTVGFAESDDFLSLRRHDSTLFVASSYQPGVGAVRYDAFVDGARRFIDDRLTWIRLEHPDAMRHRVMPEVHTRLGLSAPS